jgi:hypothetical protein
MLNSELEQRLCAVEKEVVKLKELLATKIIIDKSSAELLTIKNTSISPPPCCLVPPPPPPPPLPPPPPVPGQGATTLKIIKGPGSSLHKKQTSHFAITVEDIRKVQLRKTPSTARVSIMSSKLVVNMLHCGVLELSEQQYESAQHVKCNVSLLMLC